MMPAETIPAARSFRVEVRDGVATALLDVPGEPVNTLSEEVGDELIEVLSALGHPFAATGARMILTALRELSRRGGQHALLTICAAGGIGAALVLDGPDAAA